ncbi:MAG: dihydrodipicolinate synthase family protein [Promethearchaeota archaeon]|jgi:dihydrodipicolinate synthase/N-acetylneuraminate lyase/Ser/Thr protein kinase RdoA (MazF antagonist)
MPQINGVICNALTFFNDKFEIMEDINSLLIRHILTNDANSLLLFGNTGEGKLFSNKIEQKFDLINLVLEISKNKIPIIIRLYSNDEEDIIEEIGNLSRRFEDLRYMISPPLSQRITIDNLKLYFENILGSINPKNQILLYNNPFQCAKNDIDPNILKSLIKFPNLIGLNDSFYNIKNCKSYVQLINEDFSFFCGLEDHFQDFFQLVPINQRKNTGIVSSVSNLVNLCSKLYFYALEDNLLELIQLQEQINDFRSNIFDINTDETKEINGLKYAFLHLYNDIISTTDKEFNFINSKLQSEIEPISQEKIEAAVNYLLNNKQIYQLYPIGKKDLYQFHEIIKIFSKIGVLVQQGKVKKITGPYRADVNTIYKVRFENNQLVFRFRTSRFFQFENLIKEKLLYPFLDKTIKPDDINLREKIKELIKLKTGAYIFNREKPPIIPVYNLIYYDETKEIVPFIFSVQEYIRGKPLFQIINNYIDEGKNLNTNKFQNLFGTLGEYLGNLHDIKFDHYSKSIIDIGRKHKDTYYEIFQDNLETELHEAQKNKIDFSDDIRRYFKENKALIEDEDEFVLLHNDFNGQNVIVKEDRGVLNLNGLIDFDNWCVGSRAQDFIKIDYLILKPLNILSFDKAFYNAYSKFYNIDKEFKKKIEIYKLLWLLKEFNFESELRRRYNKPEYSSTSSVSLENYLFEIKSIIRNIFL